jgi:hypothetical protein
MRRPVTPENAETIALNALGFLVDSPQFLDRFMHQSGVDLTTIRARATERDFLAAVLDFLMSDEELLLSFCEATRTEPKVVQWANYELGGI